MKRMKLKTFKLGWCASGNHSHCRGAINNPGNKPDPVFHCDCRCHRGKKVATPPPEVQRVLHPRAEAQKVTDEWVSKCIVHGHVEVPVSSEAEARSIQGRITRTAKKGTVKITTRYVDGQVIAKVAKAPRKRKKVV